MEENIFELEAQPGYRLAIPLFLSTALPFFGALGYDYTTRGEFDSTFMWFGGFYVLIGLLYLGRKVFVKLKS